MTPSGQSVNALRAHAQQGCADARRHIDKALRDLRKQNTAINVNTVAHRAGVTRKTIYHHKDPLARIRAHTQLAPVTAADDGRPNGIIAALRVQLTAKDKETAHWF